MIAIFAGSGQLPTNLYHSLSQNHTPFIIVKCDTLAEDFPGVPVLAHHDQWGRVGALLSFLHRHHVKKIVLAGAVSRPTSLSTLKFDWQGLQWIKSLHNEWNKGDDGLLRAVMRLLEKEGFELVAAHELLPSVPKLKTLTVPDETDLMSIQNGINLLKTLSPFDIGQSVIISHQRVLGIEGPEGTDQLIQRSSPFIGDQRAVLVKMAKLGQTLKVDQPTLGSQTILQLKQYGLKGVAFEQKTTNVIDAQEMIQKANENNIFIFDF